MDSSESLVQLVSQLPKAELHLHIEGTLEPDHVMRLAAKNQVKIPFSSAEELKRLYKFKDLQSFLDLYYLATNVLQTEEDFFELTWAYLERCRQENVVHTEIFFDPQSHTSRGIPFVTVLDGIHRAMAKAEAEWEMTSRLIMCFLRHLPASEALETWKTAEPHLERIHGVGLDSAERDYPPALFKEVFNLARASGLKCVAHAGEEGPASYIREALDLLAVSRIDHGVRITEDQILMSEVAERQIPLTVCPLSNVRLGVYDSIEDHPIIYLLEQGLLITVNSDDPAYFGGYVNNNYSAVIRSFDVSLEQVVEMAKNSFTASFLDPAEIHTWLSRVDAWVTDAMSREHGT